MKEHFQLFSAPMVRGILGGLKDMTRRLVTPENSLIDGKSARTREGKALWAKLDWKSAIPAHHQWLVREKRKVCGKVVTHLIDPYVRTGDVLIGKETFRARVIDGQSPEDAVFAADYDEPEKHQPWRPSIFMPRWASRLRLEMMDTFGQRLQKISVMDCLREGIERKGPSEWRDMAPGFAPPPVTVYRDYGEQGGWILSAAACYKSLWNMLNAERGTRWDDNPPVWVRVFRRI